MTAERDILAQQAAPLSCDSPEALLLGDDSLMFFHSVLEAALHMGLFSSSGRLMNSKTQKQELAKKGGVEYLRKKEGEDD